MPLPSIIEDAIGRLSEDGNAFFDQQAYVQAIECWHKALQMLPAPQAEWQASMWLWASIGDAHFQLGRFESARDAMQDALNAPDGNVNPFVLFRLGQSHLRLGNKARATEFLLQAYMLDGEEIFEQDPDGAEALNLLESQRLLPRP